MEDVAKFLFGISGNVIALFLFLSPVPTFWRIIRNKSTEEFSGVPYNMTLLNCLLSAWYGLPFVSPNNVLVSTINGVGAVIETVYVVIFLVFASNRKARLRTLGLASAVAAVFTVVALVSMLALHGPARKLLAGLAMTVFSICMYASPLSIMRMVIKTKSVEYMPFLLSLAVFLCGTSWFIYGLLGHDLFVTRSPTGAGASWAPRSSSCTPSTGTTRATLPAPASCRATTWRCPSTAGTARSPMATTAVRRGRRRPAR
uniref:Bidirectional sugar transporter SWEET n=1 Tax=Aegilops tauschii subsp. strangulata TaxID=200361 RepID=A0A452Z613_AEGTS